MPHDKTHLGPLFKNLDSQMLSLQTVMTMSGVGLGISIFINRTNDRPGKANEGNTVQPLILIHDATIFSSNSSALPMVFLKVILDQKHPYIKSIWSA